MFYDREQIDVHLNCGNCKKRYDLPMLLSCGEVICQTCLNNIKNIGETTNEIKCPYCNIQHLVPKNGFPIQKVIFSLLKLQPLNKFRGVLVEEFANVTSELSESLNKLNTLNENSKIKIKYRVDELRKIVEEESEKKRNELRCFENKFHEKLNSYEKEALHDINLLIKGFIADSERKLCKWSELAKKDDSYDEKYLLDAIHDIGSSLKEINLHEESLKKLVDNLETIYFVESKEDFKESTIGLLQIKTNSENDVDEDYEEDCETSNVKKENNSIKSIKNLDSITQ